MIKCTTVGVEPSEMCYEICVWAYKCGALKAWEKEKSIISRRDAIKAVCNAVCECDVPHYPNCDQIKYCDEIQALISLPSAEKTGYWIEDEDQRHVEITYHCSECGFRAWGEGELTDFCGGCGARMVGDTDGN